MKKLSLITASAAALLLSACASTQPSITPTTSSLPSAQAPIKFGITGKIGVISVSSEGRQAGSAFYAWAQEEDRFSIDLTGALGIGATQIRYDGKSATLSSERTGTLTADSPEALLYQATGWQAPISRLPYWIMGRPAPADSALTHDANGRLISATNGVWQANFEYGKGALPTRLRIVHQEGHSVTLTITHS